MLSQFCHASTSSLQFRIVDQIDVRIRVLVGKYGDIGALSIEVAKQALLGQFKSGFCDFLVEESYSEFE